MKLPERDRSIPFPVVGLVGTASTAAVVKMTGWKIGISSTDLAWAALAWVVVWGIAVAVAEVSDMADSVDAAIREGGGK